MKKKKISIFINSLNGGGAERVVSILLQQLKDDFEVHLVLINKLIEYTIPPDQKIYILDKSFNTSNTLNILKIPVLAYRYYKYLRKNKIGLSFSFLTRSNFISAFLKYFNWKGTIIISERAFTSSVYTKVNFEGKLGMFLVHKLYSKSDIIVCNSELIARDLKNNFSVRSRFEVINNPIDISQVNQFISTHKDKPKTGKNPFTFVTLGRLGTEKNHAMLVKASALVKGFDFEVQIIGKGELKDKLEMLITELNIGDKVKLIPFTDNPYEYLLNSDCFVLSSNFEGFPNVILEALACGLPIISTDCRSGPRELLAPSLHIDAPLEKKVGYYEFGMLIPVNDEESLSLAMQEIMQNKEANQAYKIKNPIRAKDYDTPIIINQFRALLNDGL